MASRGDIEAGKAFITLYIKNSLLMKGLNDIKQRMQGLGSSIMGIGGALVGMGASIAAPLTLAVLQFASMGSELADLSARTGESVGSLAELKFAAEQTGSGLEDVEKAIMKMQKQGLSETFDQMAAKIAAVEDPAKRTQMAVEAWGKSGTKLLPMVDSLQQLRQEARDLGLVPTEEAVGMADAIGDSLDKIKAVINATIFEVGAALAPMLLPALETVKNIAGWFNRWAKQNGAIIRTVAMIAAGLVVAGGVIIAIGATVFGVGSAFGALATILGTVGTVLGFLLNPVTLVIAAVAAGIFIWARFTESGRAAVQGLLDFFGPLLSVAVTTIQGIGDALMAGDLTLAAEIAVAGVRLIFTQGLQQIANLFGSGSPIGQAIANIGGKLLRGDLQGAWQSVVNIMAMGWDAFVQGIVGAFKGAVDAIRALWNSMTSGIQASIGGISAALRARGLTTAATALDITNVGVGGIAGSGDAGLGFTSNIAGAVEAATAAKAQRSADAVTADGAAGAAETSDEVKALSAKLATLRLQAAAARDAANKPKDAAALPMPGVDAAKASFGTFSAAAAIAGGGSGGDRVAKTLVEMKADRAKQFDKEMQARRDLRKDIKEVLRNRMRA